MGLLATVGSVHAFSSASLVETNATGTGRFLYLEPNDDWKSDSARFACYFFIKGGSSVWADMSPEGDKYKVEVPSEYLSATAIMCRMNPAEEDNDWDNKWNQTNDLSIGDGNTCTITGWNYSETWTESSIESGLYLRGDWTNGWGFSGQRETPLNDGKYVVENLALNAGSKIKAVKYTDHKCTWPGTNEVTGDATEDGDGNVEVAATGLYKVTITWAESLLNYDVEMTADEALSAAITFAGNFNTQIGSVCQMDGSTDIGALDTAWSLQSDAYDDIKGIEGVTSYLRGATAESLSSVLANFSLKYDHVIKAVAARGQVLTDGDFLGRNPTAKYALEPLAKGSNSAVWAIAATGAAVATFGGLFLLRKRKAE